MTNVERVSGSFKVDYYTPTEKDLTVEEKSTLLNNGYSLPDDILKFADEEGFLNELYYIPHYWNYIRELDVIIDFIGYYQFITTGFVVEVNNSRYINE